MAEEEKAAEAAGEKSEAPSGGGSKLVLILTGVNLVVTLGVVAILFLNFKKEKAEPSVQDLVVEGGDHAEGTEAKEGGHGGGGHGESKAKSSSPVRMVVLEQFTVNLASTGSANPKFARVNISLESPTEDTESEITLKMPQVRNAIIDLFNSKKPSDLATPEGRNFLKDEIKNALNSFLVTGKVKGVYFTAFAVSS